MKSYLTIPNLMTYSRFILTIPLFYLIFIDNTFWALIVCLIGIISDADGTVAKWLDQKTEIGAKLDPFVDSIFMIGGIAALLFTQLITWWIVLLVIPAIMRTIIVKVSIKRNGKIYSNFWSKLSGMFIFIVIPLGILKWQYVNLFIYFTVAFNIILISKRMIDLLRGKKEIIL